MRIRRFVFIFIHFAACCLPGVAQVLPNDTLQPSPAFPAAADTSNSLPSPANKTSQTLGDTLKPAQNKAGLDTIVTYSCHDSMVFDMTRKVLVMYRAGDLKYGDIQLKADSVAISFDQTTLYADGMLDSTGQTAGLPQFKEGDQEFKAARIAFNFKTRKGRVTGARTKQEENYLLGEEAKLNGLNPEGKDILYIRNGKFTTCDAEQPHFYIRAKKLKIIPNNQIISGPLLLVIDRFPLPFVLPFGFFPNKAGRRSGILLPQYGETPDRGFFLRNLGLYWAVNDYIDLKFTTDIYSRGGYRFGVATQYNVLYRMSGTFSADYSYRKTGEFYEPTRIRQKDFFVTWKHDQKLSPSTSLTSNVNLGTSSYLKSNSYNLADQVKAKLNSSISLQTAFLRKKVSMNVALDHDQNNSTRIMTLGLPTMNMALTRQTPLSKWLQNKSEAFSLLSNLGFSYSLNAKNSISAPDTVIFGLLSHPRDSITLYEQVNDTLTPVRQAAFDYFRNGVKQSIPISSKITLGKFFSLSPSFTYNEYWYFRRRVKSYDEYIDNSGRRVADSRDTYKYGFYSMRDYSFNVEASTQLYGFYSAKGKRQTTVRHTINPRVSYNYRPDFSNPAYGVYGQVQSDTLGNTRYYERFKDVPFGIPPRGEQQRIGFTLNNNLELKYKPRSVWAKKDSASADSLASVESQPDTAGNSMKKGNAKPEDLFKKVSLLDQFTISTGYNFAADSLTRSLDLISMNARSNLFDKLIGIQASANFEPYDKDSTGKFVKKYLYETKGQLAHLNTLTLNITSGIEGHSKKEVRKEGDKSIRARKSPDYIWLQSQYADPSIPWRANFTLNYSYNNAGKHIDTTLTYFMDLNLMVSGNVRIGPNWSVDFSTGFNVLKKTLSPTSFTIARDLHCWELAFKWTPFGPLKQYSFSLSPKAALLKQLQVQKNSFSRDNVLQR